METTWEGWVELHPNTLVLSNQSAQASYWGQYPYPGYEDSGEFLFPNAMPELDTRRPVKERIMAVQEGAQGGLAFPFGEFAQADPVGVAHGEVEGRAMVVFWRSDLEGAAAFWAMNGDQELTFTIQDGEVVDYETGTTWDFTGVGSGGGLDGVRLDPVAEATVAYWGAWAAFFPNTEIWTSGGSGD